MDQALRNQLFDILNNTSSTTSMSDSTFRYEINVPKNVHWILVESAAQNQMHQEEFVEEIVAEFAAIRLRRINEKIEKLNAQEDEQQEDGDNPVEELLVGMASIEAKIESLCDYTSSLVVAFTQGLEELKKAAN